MKLYCNCGNEKSIGARRCRECFLKNKRGQLTRSQAERRRVNERQKIKMDGETAK